MESGLVSSQIISRFSTRESLPAKRGDATLIIQLIWTGILLWLLTACGTPRLEPSNQLVHKAITLQLSLAQKQLTQQLYPSELPQPAKFKITRLVVKDQEPLKIQNLPTYHVQGTYDLTIKLSTQRVTQQQNPFDIYLQRQSEGKTWRLLLPYLTGKDAQPTWSTYLIR